MYLLDTNVVSELRKVKAGKADRRVAKWSKSVDASDLYISVIALQEIELGVLLMERKDTVQGAILRVWLEDHVIPAFAGRTLDINPGIAKECANLNADSPKPYRDAFVAATVIVHRMTLVTRDIGDFSSCRVALLNPWEL